jgi:hypothetical protein
MKCVAPSHVPLRSSFVAVAQVVRFLPTITIAMSSVAPRSISPPIFAASMPPIEGRFARSSSELDRRTTCSRRVMPR